MAIGLIGGNEELHDITTLTPETGGNGHDITDEFAALLAIGAEADLSVGHRMADLSLPFVVGRFDPLYIGKGPQRRLSLEQLPTSGGGLWTIALAAELECREKLRAKLVKTTLKSISRPSSVANLLPPFEKLVRILRKSHSDR